MKSRVRLFASLLLASVFVACGGDTDTEGGSSVTVPGIPTALVATAGNASASMAFAAPASTGGSAITGYTVRCTAAGLVQTASGTASPIAITGLSNATAYTCTVTAANAQGSGSASASVSVTPTASSGTIGTFTLTSAAAVDGGTLPIDYTCDGAGSTLALSWANAPSGTQGFAVMMTTAPAEGDLKWSWVLYGIPLATTSLAKDSSGVGTSGVNSGGSTAYHPPCAQGGGAKVYTYTVYALSGTPALSVPASEVTGALLTAAIAPITLGSSSLNLSYTRSTGTDTSVACANVRNSLLASTTGTASVTCDSVHALVASNGLATHTMMAGITATNLQVPIAQDFFGTNAWKIPLAPAVATTTTAATDGPIGVAINGVPIFNPCKQGGCQNGDTKVLGELDSCNGHAGRADDYHYHAAPVCMMAGQSASYWDTHPLGWALDGFAIFGYNDAAGGIATRDSECGGNTSAVPNAPAGYSYHVTDTSPYVLSCFRGTPSADLAGQGAKYSPLRPPPVTPFQVTNMTQTTDTSDGYEVLQFTSAQAFTTTSTGTDSHANVAGSYKIRFKPVTGTALATLLAQASNSGKSSCWSFQFKRSDGISSQPDASYCR